MGFRFFCIKCGLKMEIADNLIAVAFPCPRCAKRYFIHKGYALDDDTSTHYFMKKIKQPLPPKPVEDENLRVAKVVPTALAGTNSAKTPINGPWAPKKVHEPEPASTKKHHEPLPHADAKKPKHEPPPAHKKPSLPPPPPPPRPKKLPDSLFPSKKTQQMPRPSGLPPLPKHKG